MKKKQIILIVAAVVVVAGIGAYAWLNQYLGNNVEVESVMGQQESGSMETTGTNQSGNTAAAAISSDELQGTWNIASGSKVYWSVTTSKETVNFVNEAVTGSWNVDFNDAASMTGDAVLDMTALDSENSERDGHVRDRDDLLAVGTYPQATFKTTSVSALPAEWTEGSQVPLTITGTLAVKGIDKEVTFDSKSMYRDGQLLLSGKTMVTFTDFDMTSPHTVLLETENDLAVQIEIILEKA